MREWKPCLLLYQQSLLCHKLGNIFLQYVPLKNQKNITYLREKEVMEDRHRPLEAAGGGNCMALVPGGGNVA